MSQARQRYIVVRVPDNAHGPAWSVKDAVIGYYSAEFNDEAQAQRHARSLNNLNRPPRHRKPKVS